MHAKIRYLLPTAFIILFIMAVVAWPRYQEVDAVEANPPEVAKAHAETSTNDFVKALLRATEEATEEAEKPDLPIEMHTDFFREINFLESLAAELGFFSEEDLAIYALYPEATLNQLAESGDMKAITVLADRYFKTERYEDARHWYFEASALGSLGAIMWLDSSTFSIDARNIQTVDALSIEEKRQAIWEKSLAWKLVMEKRGYVDFLGLVHSGVYEGTNRVNAEQLAEQYYTDLQNRRYEMGLGDFETEAANAFYKGLTWLYDLESKYKLPLPEFNQEESRHE